MSIFGYNHPVRKTNSKTNVINNSLHSNYPKTLYCIVFVKMAIEFPIPKIQISNINISENIALEGDSFNILDPIDIYLDIWYISIDICLSNDLNLQNILLG